MSGAATIVAELGGLQDEQDPLIERLKDVHARRAELLGMLTRSDGPTGALVSPDVSANTEEQGASAASEVVVQKGVELGCRVYLDEDVYNGAHVPPKVYVFEAYDSEAPAESNCTLVDAANGDWTVRGIGELVPVDDAATDDEGGA